MRLKYPRVTNPTPSPESSQHPVPLPLFLRACRGEATPRTPLWMMRQAGRYLPEYRQVRASVSFLELCKTPRLAAEVTLQPIRRFGFDAAILFSDLLVPLEAMGLEVQFTEQGPRLPALLAETTRDYLLAQVAAGAQAIQIFDSWVGVVSPDDWDRFVFEPTAALIAAVRQAGVPVIYFANGATTIFDRVARVGADVYGVDWRLPLDEARARLGGAAAVQGNLDPSVLLGPVAEIERRAADVVRRGGGRGHIFNLGHGIVPETPIEGVEALMRTVRGGG